MRAALVIPAWNQWDHTRRFLESCLASGEEGLAYVVVDNGSTDGTRQGLAAWKKRLPLTVIANPKNLGCAPAWNQGVKAALKMKPDWVGVLNNDLLVSRGWLTPLLRRAEERGWALASPATREGRLDYDLDAYAAAYTRRCRGWDTEGYFGWCFLVKPEAFKWAGMFDESYRWGKGEDEDFVRRLRVQGLKTGISGCSFIHHVGSASIDALKAEVGEEFERKNLALLYQRWGEPERRHLAGKAGTFLLRRWQKLRWGHLLKE